MFDRDLRLHQTKFVKSPLMRVAYLTNYYPKISHTFIRREILALEGQGVEVMRFALRGWDAELVDPIDQSELEKTQYTLKDGLGSLLFDMLRCMVKRPGPFWKAVKTALAMSRNGVRPWPYHLIYVGHACRICRWMEGKGVTHLHAHFGTNPAEIALLVNILGGPKYSFTIHGMDEADDGSRLAFDRKVVGGVFGRPYRHGVRPLLRDGSRQPVGIAWEKAWNAIVNGDAEHSAPSATAALERAYARDENDEFVAPTVIENSGIQTGLYPNDSVIFINFRADRARELTAALAVDEFSGFDRGRLSSSRGGGDVYGVRRGASRRSRLRTGVPQRHLRRDRLWPGAPSAAHRRDGEVRARHVLFQRRP